MWATREQDFRREIREDAAAKEATREAKEATREADELVQGSKRVRKPVLRFNDLDYDDTKGFLLDDTQRQARRDQPCEVCWTVIPNPEDK